MKENKSIVSNVSKIQVRKRVCFVVLIVFACISAMIGGCGSDSGSEKDTSTNVKAFQDGVELDIAMMMDDSVYDAGLGQKDIKPGTTLGVQSAFVLTSKSPVEVEVSELISFDDFYLAKTFEIE